MNFYLQNSKSEKSHSWTFMPHQVFWDTGSARISISGKFLPLQLGWDCVCCTLFFPLQALWNISLSFWHLNRSAFICKKKQPLHWPAVAKGDLWWFECHFMCDTKLIFQIKGEQRLIANGKEKPRSRYFAPDLPLTI